MSFIINFIKNNLIISTFVFIGAMLTIVLIVSDVFNKELLLTKTSFANGSAVTTPNTWIPVIFYFPEEINTKTIKITISPETKTVYKTQVEGAFHILKIFPNPWWKYDTNYTITIDKNLTSINSARLKKDIVFNFSLKFPSQEEMPPQPGPPPGF